VAIGAPTDPKQKGLMLYVLRYEAELRDPKASVSGIKESSVDPRELALAKQLILGNTSKFNLTSYKDDYEAAVKKLIDAKRKGKSLPEAEPQPSHPKVVNIMDALRESLTQSKKQSRSTSKKKTHGRRAA
jgi:DNA end-binding protein Ku